MENAKSNDALMLEKIKRVSGRFEREVALMKWRAIGTYVLLLAMIGAMVFVFQSKSYLVIDREGNVYTTKKVERTDKEILLIEADAHARNFYSTMWTFDHGNIDKQIKRAGYLGGDVVTDLYTKLKGEGFYNDIRLNGYYVKSSIDSVDFKSFSFNGKSVYIKCYGSMELTNNTFYELRRLDLEMEMRLVERILEKNPNGLSIEALNLLNNNVISNKKY